MLSAWSSFLFIQQPGYASSGHYAEQTLFPCIYLWLVFVIAMLPMMKLNSLHNVTFESSRFLRAMMIVCSVIQIVFFAVDIPVMKTVLSSGSFMLKTLRAAVYDDGLSRVFQMKWLNRISLLYSGLRIPATGLSIILFFTWEKDRRLVNLFALTCVMNNIRIIIVQVGRGEMVFVFLLYACLIYLLRDNISAKAKRRLVMLAVPVLIIGGMFFWAISISRFGSKAGLYFYKYLGESMNNFDGILFNRIHGQTNGRAYFSIFFRYLLGEVDYSNAAEKWNLIYKTTGITGQIFYTWVGGIIIEFGKIAPFFVAIAFNLVSRNLTAAGRYYYGDFFILVFFINFFIRGIFIFPTQNFEGTFMILYTVLLYFAFRIRLGKNGQLIYIKPVSRYKKTLSSDR